MESNDRYVNLLRGYLESIHGSYISSFCTWILPLQYQVHKKNDFNTQIFFFPKISFFLVCFLENQAWAYPQTVYGHFVYGYEWTVLIIDYLEKMIYG